MQRPFLGLECLLLIVALDTAQTRGTLLVCARELDTGYGDEGDDCEVDENEEKEDEEKEKDHGGGSDVVDGELVS